MEEWIVTNYGPNWRTPKKDWDWWSSASNLVEEINLHKDPSLQEGRFLSSKFLKFL